MQTIIILCAFLEDLSKNSSLIRDRHKVEGVYLPVHSFTLVHSSEILGLILKDACINDPILHGQQTKTSLNWEKELECRVKERKKRGLEKENSSEEQKLNCNPYLYSPDHIPTESSCTLP